MKTILYDAKIEDAYGIVWSYIVEKEILDDSYFITTYYIKNGQRIEKSKIKCLNIVDYENPFLSWYNVLFCSASYSGFTDHIYMKKAVQENKKTAATIYIKPDSEEGRLFMKSLPENCSALPYGEHIYIFHKGCLAKYFRLEEIKNIYDQYGLYHYDWDKINRMFEKDLSFFVNEEKCGFDLQNTCVGEELILTGLILGYPVESTAEYLCSSSGINPY